MIPGPLGMGGAPLGNLFDHINETVAAATVSAAWDSGVRHFDTAPHYGAGLSEHRIGAVLRLHPRDAYTLSTKVGRVLEPAPDLPERAEGFVGGLPFRRRFDYSAEGALRSLEDSMQRLGLSRVDTVYIHDLSEDWHGSEWPEKFREAMKSSVPLLDKITGYIVKRKGKQIRPLFVFVHGCLRMIVVGPVQGRPNQLAIGKTLAVHRPIGWK